MPDELCGDEPDRRDREEAEHERHLAQRQRVRLAAEVHVDDGALGEEEADRERPPGNAEAVERGREVARREQHEHGGRRDRAEEDPASSRADARGQAVGGGGGGCHPQSGRIAVQDGIRKIIRSRFSWDQEAQVMVSVARVATDSAFVRFGLAAIPRGGDVADYPPFEGRPFPKPSGGLGRGRHLDCIRGARLDRRAGSGARTRPTTCRTAGSRPRSSSR